jgi:hypothetical protein
MWQTSGSYFWNFCRAFLSQFFWEFEIFLNNQGPLSVFQFCGVGVWTQGLHLELFYQPHFCGGFFQVRVLWILCCPCWFWTAFLLISASWVARVTSMSHWHLPWNLSWPLVSSTFCPLSIPSDDYRRKLWSTITMWEILLSSVVLVYRWWRRRLKRVPQLRMDVGTAHLFFS